MSVKKKKNQFVVRPTYFAACVEIAGSVVAGGLLSQLAIMSSKGTLTDEHNEKGWIAMSSEQWRVVTGYSRSQHNESLSKLKKAGLIEQRKRRVFPKDPAAIAWLRITKKVKSEISEIMERPALSAFTENKKVTLSDNSEIGGATNYAKSVNLVKNNKLKELKEKELAEAKQKEFSKKIQVIYTGSEYPPDTYDQLGPVFLNHLQVELSKNPKGFFAYCSPYEDKPVVAMQIAVSNWEDFRAFAFERYYAIHLPEKPSLLSMKDNIEAIGDFVRFKSFQVELEGWATQLKRKLGLDASSLENFDLYIEAQSKSLREELVISIVEKHPSIS